MKKKKNRTAKGFVEIENKSADCRKEEKVKKRNGRRKRETTSIPASVSTVTM